MLRPVTVLHLANGRVVAESKGVQKVVDDIVMRAGALSWKGCESEAQWPCRNKIAPAGSLGVQDITAFWSLE